MNITAFTVIGLFTTGILLAQQPVMSGNSYVGEAIDSDPEQAKAAARADLILQIQNFIRVESTVTKSETARGIDSRSNQKVTSFASARLSGLTYSIFELPDGNYKVVAYISKDDYRNGMEALATEIRSAWEAVRLRELERGEAAVFSDWYLLYLKCFYSPEPIQAGEIPDLKSWLQMRMRSVIQDASVVLLSADQGEMQDDPVSLQLGVNYKDVALSGLSIRDSRQGGAPRQIRGGVAPVSMYGLPSGFTHSLQLEFSPVTTPEEAGQDLFSIHEEAAFRITRQVKLDFRPFIRIGFSGRTQKSNIVKFVPEIRLLSVSGFLWDFGDGTTSTEQQPKQFFEDPNAIYPVSMMLNNNPELKSTQWIRGDGTLAKPPVPEPTPSAANWRNLQGTELWKALSHIRNADSLMIVLQDLKSRGKLIFGRAGDFPEPDACQVIVYHPKTKEISAFLSPGITGYRDAISDAVVKSVSSYKGQAAIYLVLR